MPQFLRVKQITRSGRQNHQQLISRHTNNLTHAAHLTHAALPVAGWRQAQRLKKSDRGLPIYYQTNPNRHQRCGTTTDIGLAIPKASLEHSKLLCFHLAKIRSPFVWYAPDTTWFGCQMPVLTMNKTHSGAEGTTRPALTTHFILIQRVGKLPNTQNRQKRKPH